MQGWLSTAAASQFIARVKDDFLHIIEMFPVNDAIVASAVGLAERYGLRAADSVHLATMIDLQRASTGAGVPYLALIVDRNVRDAAQAEQVTFLNPEDRKALDNLRQFRQAPR